MKFKCIWLFSETDFFMLFFFFKNDDNFAEYGLQAEGSKDE